MSESGSIIFSRDEVDLIVAFAGCSLDEKPGSNWVQDAGGLPEYICQIARAIKKTGKSTSQAIAIAVSRVKKWATGAGVDKDTQAKAAKAVAEWEKKRAKAKGDNKKVAASNTDRDVVLLAASTDYPVTMVADAYRRRQNEAREAYYKANPSASYKDVPGRGWVREQWTKFLIVSGDYDDTGAKLYKVPYAVDAKLNVTFEDPTPVKTAYVAVATEDVDDTGLSDVALAALANAQPACQFTATNKVMQLTRPEESALARVLAYRDKE